MWEYAWKGGQTGMKRGAIKWKRSSKLSAGAHNVSNHAVLSDSSWWRNINAHTTAPAWSKNISRAPSPFNRLLQSPPTHTSFCDLAFAILTLFPLHACGWWSWSQSFLQPLHLYALNQATVMTPPFPALKGTALLSLFHKTVMVAEKSIAIASIQEFIPQASAAAPQSRISADVTFSHRSGDLWSCFNSFCVCVCVGGAVLCNLLQS